MTERVERPSGSSLLDARSAAGSGPHKQAGARKDGRIGEVVGVTSGRRTNGRSRRPAPQLDTLAGVPLPDGPVAVCANGTVLGANADLAELVGAADPMVLTGMPVRELLAEDGEHSVLRPVDPTDDTLARPVRVVRWPLPAVADPDRPQSDELVPTEALLFVDLSEPVTRENAGERRVLEAHAVADMGSWEYDCGSGETAWSPSHFSILGLDPETTTPGVEAMLGVVHPDDVELVQTHWREQREAGEPVSLEYRIVRPDGEVRRIRGEANPVLDESGNLVRISGYIRDITDGWNIRTELAQERARLLEAQQIAKLGSWAFEVATGTVYLSEGMREFAEEAGAEPGADPLSVLHNDDLPGMEAMVGRLLAGQETGTLEVELHPKEHRDRVYICRAQAVFAADGSVERLQGTLQDVTEQRALERQLRSERRRLDDAQRVARMGTFEWNPATGETVWSDMLHELFGIAPNYPINYSAFLQLVHPADRQWVDDIWQQVALDQQPVECEYRIVRPDGLVRVLRCNGAVVNSVDGPPLVVGTAQDVTEQRAAEARVERTSQRFTDLVSVTPVGIGLFDYAERLVDANGALCELLGMDIDQLRGLTADQLTHPDDRADRLRSSAVNGGVGSYKIPQRILLGSDGEPIYCELHVANSVHDDGRRFWLVVFQDITERRRAAEALRHQATHDDLTGLPNRAAVKELLAGLLSGPTRENVAVLFCDIDNFKRVNDSLGHDAGDELLVALARRLEGGLPEGCTAARLSGDEYVIICADIEACGGVDALATKVASLLRTVVPVHGQLVRVSASIGAAVPSTTGRTTGDDLLRFADAAMFEAKRRGPGRVSLASATLMANADRQVHLEGQLREALSTDGLELYYQPVVGPDGSVQTAEALIRWPHPDRGLLPPNVFLPVAEQGDLLRELDRWVLSKALREAADWPLQDGKPVAVAVNLAGLVPGDPDFVDSVSNAVAESGIAWDRVVLELVETALVDLPSRTRQQMGVLVDKGVRFAVDDFGTGYSSLARLKELPAQIIKVDRMFVAGVGTDPSDFAVARALVDMARAMGRSCVAEGVETATQFHVLRGVGVDAYQGWLFSRAVPAKEFRAILSLGPLHVPRAS